MRTLMHGLEQRLCDGLGQVDVPVWLACVAPEFGLGWRLGFKQPSPSCLHDFLEKTWQPSKSC